MKKMMTAFAVLLFVACGPKEVLPAEDWDPDVHATLTTMIRDAGKQAGKVRPYAVFDCDNTSIRHDVTHTLMLYAIENLRFAAAPAHDFLDGVDHPETVLEGCDGLTAAEMGRSLSARYAKLRALREAGIPMDTLRRTELYLDWRARMLAMYKGIGKSCSYGELCLWMPSLLEGMPKEEALALGRESLAYWFSFGKVWKEEWVSPDGRFRAVADKGLVLTPRMRHLYASLEKHGFDVYIVSASPEWLVELFACDPVYGLGLSEEQVYGIRMLPEDRVHALYDPDYPQPFKEGKVANIKRFLFPSHKDQAPALVAGDSVGDLAMLTEWETMRTGLLMDIGRTDDFAGLVRQARAGGNRGRFVAQTVN